MTTGRISEVRSSEGGALAHACACAICTLPIFRCGNHRVLEDSLSQHPHHRCRYTLRMRVRDLKNEQDREAIDSTPVFLPGESQGQGNLVGCHLWGQAEPDTTEVT